MTEALQNPNTPNTYTVIEGKLAFQALGDRIIVKEDKFKTGYECKECDGSGHTDEPCSLCKGTLQEEDGTRCRACRAGTSDGIVNYGFKLCPSCNGRQATIIIAQVAERRPTTGTVVSVGPDVKTISLGDHVLYNNFSGHAIDFKGKTVIRILHENEVMAHMYAVLNQLVSVDLGSVVG